MCANIDLMLVQVEKTKSLIHLSRFQFNWIFCRTFAEILLHCLRCISEYIMGFPLNVPAHLLYELNWFESICHLSGSCPRHGTINFRQSDFRHIQVERALLLPFPVWNLEVFPFPFLARNLAVLPSRQTPIEEALLSLWTVFEGALLRLVRLFHLVSSKVNFNQNSKEKYGNMRKIVSDVL